jgi:hypothetical protein
MKAKCRPENSWKRQSALVKFYAKMTGIKNYEEVKNTFENLKILKNNFRKGVVTMEKRNIRIIVDSRWDAKLEFYWLRNTYVGDKNDLMEMIKNSYLKYEPKIRWAIISNVGEEEYGETLYADGRVEIPEWCIIPETKRSKYLNA